MFGDVTTTDTPAKTVNAALITDVLAFEAAVALSGEAVITPSSLFALNSLVEAIVLHEYVYAGLWTTIGSAHGVVKKCPTMQTLCTHRILGQPTTDCAIALKLNPSVLVEELGDPGFIVCSSPKAELANLSLMADFARLFQIDSKLCDVNEIQKAFGIRIKSASNRAEIENSSIYERIRNIFYAKQCIPPSPSDIASLHEAARKMRAYWNVAERLNIQLYPSLFELPIYSSFLTSMPSPSGPLKTVQKAKEELMDLYAWYYRIGIPAFLGIVLNDCDDLGKFANVLIEVRNHHKAYRHTHTAYCEKMLKAENRGEQRQLILEHDKAWETLLRKETPKTSRITHIFQKMGLKALAGNLCFGQDRQSLMKIEGLVDLWESMKKAPSTGSRSKIILEGIFGKVADIEHWHKVRQITTPIESILRGSGKETRPESNYISTETSIIIGDINMGDTFKDIHDATIINRSMVEGSFNKIRSQFDEETADVLKKLAAQIERSGNKEAAENFDSFNEELLKPQPKKSVLRSLWGGITTTLPSILQMTNIVTNISKLLSD